MQFFNYLRNLTFLFLLILPTQIFAQLVTITPKSVTGVYIYDDQLWYIENSETKIFDLKTQKDITEKYKVYSRTFTPIASSGTELWIINSNNLFVLSKVKTKRYNLPKQLDGIEIGRLETYRNFIPIGLDSLLIRGLANRAGKNETPRMVKVDAVYTGGKLNEITDYVPSGSAIDFIDVAYTPQIGSYVTDSWMIQRKTKKGFSPIDLSAISGAQSISLGKVALDGSLWAYQAGEGLIHVTKKSINRVDYGRSQKFLKGEKVDFIEVLENGLVAICTESEIWLMMKDYFYPLKTDFKPNKIKMMKSWKNKLIVALNEGLILIDSN
jgi:hypothetical protein